MLYTLVPAHKKAPSRRCWPPPPEALKEMRTEVCPTAAALLADAGCSLLSQQQPFYGHKCQQGELACGLQGAAAAAAAAAPVSKCCLHLRASRSVAVLQ
jgi:hypothetical protein